MAASLLTPGTAKAISESVAEILSRKGRQLSVLKNITNLVKQRLICYFAEDLRHDAIYDALLASRHEELKEDVVTAAFRRSRFQRLSAFPSVQAPPATAAAAVLSTPEFKK
jgi:hypothetical protein